MKHNREYYVYVYIDPRNNEEFYYGKGRGNRKSAHLLARGDSAKVKRIKDIYKEGEQPKVKVIAADLTEDQAFLVESTLLWKLGNNLTNVASGVFAGNFRPQNTLHKELPGFDFKHSIHLVNVGEGPHRCWADSRQYGFLSAGQQRKYSEQLEGLQTGDVVVAYLNKHGYVGLGIVEDGPIRVREFRYRGKTMKQCRLKQPNIYDNADDADDSEYLVKVRWKKTVDAKRAKWKAKAGLFTTRLVRASLINQTKTLRFLESEFGIRFRQMIKE
ncbi:MAG: GIY-YIG nuclease family protein [Candidatus Aureabacteria bacterium]|nr:GIY-YIG nuclease family protein [Candidatus Auribacterota bacterium]